MVNQLALRPWDIDHVLIGPGGAVVVETKWSANPWVLDPPDERVRRAVRQAQGNARDLRLWGRSRAQGFAEVLPVISTVIDPRPTGQVHNHVLYVAYG